MSLSENLLQPFWTTLTLPPGQSLRWNIGPLSLWVRREVGEWQIVVLHSEGEDHDARWSLAQPESLPFDAKIQRFAVESESNELTFAAAFPERSIVARPEEPIEIPAGARANFICGVPLTVKISGSGKELTSVLTRELTKTWFGSPKEGEACFGTLTRAVRDHQQLPVYGFRALCPVRVLNRSKAPLRFERICLRVRHLDLYHGHSGLWSNEVGIIKETVDEASRIVYRRDAPPQAPEASRVFKAAQDPPSDNFVARTFSGIRALMDIH
ncbi:MAG: hypothetical protein ACI8UO_003609 [Verrucomicrobiales bacterium]|jgi:hypothetical protein